MQTKSVFHASEEQRFLTTHLVACCEQVVQLAKKGLRDWNTLEHIGTCCQCYSAPQLSEVRTTRWLGCRLLGIPRSAREAIRPAEHTELKRDSNDELLIRLQSLQLAWRIWRLSFALHSIMFLNLQSVPFLLTRASQLKVCTFAILLLLIQWYMLIDTDRIWYWSQCVWVFCLFLQFRHCYCYWAPGFIQQRWATSLWRLRSVGTRWRFSRVSVQNSNTLNSVNECTHYARKSMLVHIYIYCIYSCHILTHYIASSLYIMI